MGVPQRQLLEVIRENCDAVAEGDPVHARELLRAVAEIVALERQHNKTPTNVVQKIAAQIEALAEVLPQSAAEVA